MAHLISLYRTSYRCLGSWRKSAQRRDNPSQLLLLTQHNASAMSDMTQAPENPAKNRFGKPYLATLHPLQSDVWQPPNIFAFSNKQEEYVLILRCVVCLFLERLTLMRPAFVPCAAATERWMRRPISGPKICSRCVHNDLRETQDMNKPGL